MQIADLRELILDDIKYLDQVNIPISPGCFVNQQCTLLGNEIESEIPHQLLIVDCRWPYEYLAGHVKSAVNYYEGIKLKNDLFLGKGGYNLTDDVDIFFYCQYSQVRAVRMSNYMRHLIKNHNCCRDIFVVDGGFDRIYNSYRDIVDGKYIAEKNVDYQQQMLYYSNNGKYDLNIPQSDGESDAESVGVL